MDRLTPEEINFLQALGKRLAFTNQRYRRITDITNGKKVLTINTLTINLNNLTIELQTHLIILTRRISSLKRAKYTRQIHDFKPSFRVTLCLSPLLAT